MLQKPKGTRDILPENSYKWQYVEEKVKNLLKNYGFKEIRTPVFEHTELLEKQLMLFKKKCIHLKIKVAEV